jgi:hypothetical protein
MYPNAGEALDMSEMFVSAETISNAGVRRRITLEPLHRKALAIEVREVESTIPCGFQQHWGDGKYGKKKFDMGCGAGFGSRWMTFTVGEHNYCISADDIAKAVLAFDEELYPQPTPKRKRKAK